MTSPGSPPTTFWQKTKTGSKAGFDKLWAYADKLGAPVNKLSNKLGSEAFWPSTLDKESDKAARILRSFCKDGFYQEETKQPKEGPTQKQRVIKKIPSEVIRNAKGLAIFTTMRTGLWVSGAGGSGVVVARKDDGTWSPPVGIMLHTAGLGFLIGVDIYDCVLVLNTQTAVDAFTKVRCTIGGEISAVAGPVGAGGVFESEVHARQAPIFTYLKSRGFYAGVQVDGTVVIERTDETNRFYGSDYTAKQILSGSVSPPYSVKGLLTTLKSAQGEEVDESLMPTEPPPADYEVEQGGHVFGIPDKEDPDPFGVEALSKEGLEVKNATTHSRPEDTEFQFRPKQDSVAYAILNRQDTGVTSPRKEAFGNDNHKRYASSDHSTQTDLGLPGSATSPGPASPGGPIMMDDNEATLEDSKPDSRSASMSRSSFQDVSLNEEPKQSAPKLPIRRLPPPVLPPRNTASVTTSTENVTTEEAKTDAEVVEEPKASESGAADHTTTDLETTEQVVPESKTIEPLTAEPETTELKASELDTVEAKPSEPDVIEPTTSETKNTEGKHTST